VWQRVPQAALLVGLLRSPETADPTEDPEEAAARRSTVLQDLVETGTITPEESAAAAATPVAATPRTSAVSLTAGVGPHFVEWVREQAIDAVGEEALYSKGLQITTTLDLRAQAAAESAVAGVLTDPAGPQAAIVALDTDGAVRAHVGGRDFEALQVDLVRGADGGGSGRQPGSTFKPFVLEAALEAGITLGDRYAAPRSIELDVGGAPFVVDNYGGTGFGDLTVAEATASSVNTVYAQLLAEVGPDAVAAAATTMGIDAKLDAVPAIALGVEELSPLDLASAYLTLADDGSRVEPYAILRIEDAQGRLLWEPDRSSPEEDVIDPGISRAVTHALRGVIDNGTGQAAGIGRPAAGKTGTTQDNVDAWFAGYVPGYAAVVWMGYPDPAPMDDVQGRSVTGGAFPAQIWAEFMRAAMDGREVEDFPEPPDELLRAAEPASLTVEPAEADPGATITIHGTGFAHCRTSWSVAVEGTPLASAPDAGSSESARTATLTLPADLAPAAYRVLARCDSGAGPQDAAVATLTVRGLQTPSSSSTTTTLPDESTTTDPGNGNTTSTTSTTTTGSPSG
jgi:penicillin-binding protein 1A